MMNELSRFTEQIRNYIPFNEEEIRDRELILACLAHEQDIFTRENKLVHFSASGWVVNPGRTKVLLAYHNIYQSWTWLGGHADGETDLLQVALREVKEESGVTHVRPVTEEIFSLESLTVDGHIKRGAWVSSHIHLNLTYLLEASEEDLLTVKADENSGVAWFPIEEALTVPDEPWMVEHIFTKLNQKLLHIPERNLLWKSTF
ncbi:MAG: NUDIX hydrolase [Lachnospiraceae bacterium]|nr:NUDIX hydrolase [Lachnospiraceae bacterium]